MPAAKEQLATLMLKIDSATNHINSIKQDIAERTKELKEVEDECAAEERRKAKLVAENDNYEAELTAKKGKIDEKIVKYEDDEKAKATKRLASITNKLDAAKSDLKATTTSLKAAREDLSTAQSNYNDLAILTDRQKEDSESAIKTLKDSIKELTDQETKLKKDVQKLNYQASEAVAATNRAEEKHKQFVDYEKSARKVLDAKDRSLQEKEADLNEQSQFIRARRSNLPQM